MTPTASPRGQKLVSRADLALIFVLLLVCLGLLLWRQLLQSDTRTAVVEKNGAVVFTCPLTKGMAPVERTVDGTAVTVRIDESGAAVVSSDCPDQICVRAGRLQDVGDCAVCLPNRVTMRIEGAKAGVDGVTG